MLHKRKIAQRVSKKAHKILQRNDKVPKLGEHFFEEVPKLKKVLLDVKQCFFDIEMLFSKNQIKCKSIHILGKDFSHFHKEILDEIINQELYLKEYNDEHNRKNPEEAYGFMLFANKNFLDKTYYDIDDYLKKFYILIDDTILEYITGNVEQSETRVSQNYKKLSGKLINTLSLNLDSYIEVYSIENYLRAYILVKYKIQYKSENLTELFKSNKKIQEKALSRKMEDDKNGWTEPRGRTLLSYLDFDELKKLVVHNDNWSLFEKDFPDQDFIRIRFNELYQVRNKIAHNANVTQQEFDMIKMYSNQIFTQLKKYDDEIKLIEL